MKKIRKILQGDMTDYEFRQWCADHVYAVAGIVLVCVWLYLGAGID